MSSNKLEFNDMSNVLSLESQLEKLALEATVLTNVVDTFKTLIPNTYNKIKETMNSLTSFSFDEEQISDIKKEYLLAKVKINTMNYTAYNKTLIMVPEGFKGELIEYIQLLNNMTGPVYNDLSSLLVDYNFILSSFINNKDDKMSLRDHTVFFNRIKKSREDKTKQLDLYFNNNSSVSRVYLGSVIGRMSDIDTVITLTDKIKVEHKKCNLVSLLESLKGTIGLLDILVNDSKYLKNISGNAALNLSIGAYEVGKFIEFIVSFRYKVEQIITTVLEFLFTVKKIA